MREADRELRRWVADRVMKMRVAGREMNTYTENRRE